ncbi:MAG TPA: cupredoxin family protein [Pseudolabrys sp.]|nr:cupredoxin family protein [Pseudolabrys sp.]
MKKASAVAASALLLGSALGAVAHDAEHFSAGEPGNPKKPARTVTVIMTDSDGAMRYSPDRLNVKKGEQVRFVIQNNGVLKHEFTLASVEDNNKHAVLMQKYPDMEHDDPNAKSIDPGKTAEILWRFSKTGTFEFACLIPGHREAGMHGTIAVR